jgi:HEAT repeat protein
MTDTDLLRAKLKSEEYGERMQALVQSRSLSESERFEFVTIASGDRNTRIRYDAVSQMATLGSFNLEKSLEILSDRLLHDPEMDVKAAAADAIGALKLTAAFPDLANAYNQNNDWMMQFSIIAALGELGDVRGFELLAEALANNPNDLVKIAAIGALGELGDLRALDLLLPLVDSPDWQIRHRLVQAFANIGSEPAIAALKKLTDDPIAQVAEIAKILSSNLPS